MVFDSPLWLAGLALLPVLWWLHRRASRGRTVLVPSLTLFKAARPSAGATDGMRTLDGAFWRRAALITALTFALAAPTVLGGGSRIVVWVDDSLSMRSREAAGTRLELGCRMLAQSLSARRATDVIVRSLGEPGAARRVKVPFTPGAVCGARSIVPPQPPLVPLMSRAEEHWLLTDGASAPVDGWAARAPLTRVLQVGQATENVAVVRLAARGELSDPTRFDVDVEVANLGKASAHRTLTITRGNTRLSSAPLAPGSSASGAAHECACRHGFLCSGGPARSRRCARGGRPVDARTAARAGSRGTRGSDVRRIAAPGAARKFESQDRQCR